MVVVVMVVEVMVVVEVEVEIIEVKTKIHTALRKNEGPLRQPNWRAFGISEGKKG
jgi:hypothetical protein